MNNSEYIFKIPDLTISQGDTLTIPFEFYDGENMPIDLTRHQVEWRLCPYGQPDYPILEKKALISETHTERCYVNLTHNDTKGLPSGLYTQQPIVIATTVSGGAMPYVRARGNILLEPYIKENA